MSPHRSKPSRYFEGHEVWYLSPDSTSGCQGLSNEPSNTSESKRVKFYVFSTGGTPWKFFVPFGPPFQKNTKILSLSFRYAWWLVWKPSVSWGGIWAQISNFMNFKVARWFWSMCEINNYSFTVQSQPVGSSFPFRISHMLRQIMTPFL